MNAAIANHHGPVDILTNMRSQIVKRTWGRVSQLHVERVHDRIVIHGFTPSYYVKQLVLQAALEALDGVLGVPVTLDIKIGVHAQRA
jgi:hypothetical protein